MLDTGSDGCATSTDGVVATMVSGVKSATGSKGSLGNSVALIVWLVNDNNKVLPSGAALATASAARLPPAPARFSINTVRPSNRPISGAISRASVSVLPPGAAPTMILIGGWLWADASSGKASSVNRQARRRNARMG